MADLRARLKALTDLEGMQCRKLDNIDRLYLARTLQISQMVQIMCHILSKRRARDSRTTPINLCDIMRRGLQVWCARLIQVTDFTWNRVDALDDNATIQTKVICEVAFLHPTARDLTESESAWATLVGCTASTDFDPYVTFLGLLKWKVWITCSSSGRFSNMVSQEGSLPFWLSHAC